MTTKYTELQALRVKVHMEATQLADLEKYRKNILWAVKPIF
jgi:hypothetical protein